MGVIVYYWLLLNVHSNEDGWGGLELHAGRVIILELTHRTLTTRIIARAVVMITVSVVVARGRLGLF